MTQHSKTDCTRFEDDLKAYADGELSPLRRWAARRHLTRCASCQKEIAAMTQMTDDLRSSEPEDALPPTLREKMLEVPLTPNNGGTGTEPLPSGSPIIRGGGASSRRIPAWTFAALALVAWFIFYPLYQKTRQQAQTASATAPLTGGEAEREIKAFQRLPAAPQERLLPPSNATGNFTTNGSSDQAASAPEKAPSAAAAPPMPARVMPPSEAPPAPPVVAGNFGARSLNAVSALPDTDLDTQRQVHKEASIGVQVPNPEATGDTLNQMVQDTGGYVAANNLSTDPAGMKSGELIVKVPEPQFETFLAQVAKLGTVVSKNVTGQDITEKTSDAHEAQSVEESDLTQAEARLKALGSHAKWEDTQNAEDLRVQLAQTRARLKLLKRMAALGTITIDLSQTPKAAAAAPVTNGFTNTLKATTHDALQSLVGSAGALLALVIWLLAYAPIWVPLLLLGRYALREYKKRQAV